ncbi:TIR domain-containing protein [Mariniblastus sp.]|nr:TIR domain-containing protein [Mariniblastus sp.]
MNEIFVSYRRSDSQAETGRIYDYVAKRFGEKNVFKDVDAIRSGDNFRELINSAVDGCKCLLVIIGPDWNDKDQAGEPRLNADHDWVRTEIRIALDRNISVIPVLVGNAAMPTPDSLPDDIRELADRQAISVRPDPDFKPDVGRLISRIRDLGVPYAEVRLKRRTFVYSGVAALIAMCGFLVCQSLLFSKAKTVVRVGLKQWVGYTPLAVAKELQLFPDDIEVEFVNVGSVSDMRRMLADDEIDVSLGLVETHIRDAEKYLGRDEQSNLRRPVAFLKIDTSLGADGIIARQEIDSVYDLAKTEGREGRKFFYQHHDVSHFLFLVLCQKDAEKEKNSGSEDKRDPIEFRNLREHRDDTNVEDAYHLFQKDLDSSANTYYAVGTYEPYLSKLKTEKTKVLIDSSSEDVAGLVVDIMATKKLFLDRNKSAIQSLCKGWYAAVDLLNEREHARQDVLDAVLKFNGTPLKESDWSAENWKSNDPCSMEEYVGYLDGMTDGDRTINPWPTKKDNENFFRSWDNHPSEFERVFNECKAYRKGKKLQELDPHYFQAYGDVFPLSE